MLISCSCSRKTETTCETKSGGGSVLGRHWKRIFEQRSQSSRGRRAVVQRLRQVEAPQWEDAGFSYPLALSLTQHLVKRRGLHGLVRVLELLGQGADLDQALLDEFGADYRSLCRSWGAEALQEGMR